MKERYKEILDKAYELEGLLMIALKRDEMPEGLDKKIEKTLSELSKFRVAESPDKGDKNHDGFSSFYSLEEEDDAAVCSPAKEEAVVPGTENASKGRKPEFSLNDKFLYIRELFGGNSVAFNKAIDKISEMGSYGQAEKYLIAELKLNPEENQMHADYLAIVERAFHG